MKSNVSLRSFATSIGKSAAFISDIELGRRYPSPDVLELIAKELKVDLSELEKLDSRGSIDDLKKLMQRDPSWGMAFRTIADSAQKMSAEEFIKKITRAKDDK